MVWISATQYGMVFHLRPDCPGRSGHQLYEAKLADIDRRVPCMRCCEDAPERLSFDHSFCVICGSARPCRHNGGMAVAVEMGGLHGIRVRQTRWMWPDSLRALAKGRSLVFR